MYIHVHMESDRLFEIDPSLSSSPIVHLPSFLDYSKFKRRGAGRHNKYLRCKHPLIIPTVPKKRHLITRLHQSLISPYTFSHLSGVSSRRFGLFRWPSSCSSGPARAMRRLLPRCLPAVLIGKTGLVSQSGPKARTLLDMAFRQTTNFITCRGRDPLHIPPVQNIQPL